MDIFFETGLIEGIFIVSSQCSITNLIYRLKGTISSAAFPAKGLFFPGVHAADEGLMYGITPAPHVNHVTSQNKVVRAVPEERLGEHKGMRTESLSSERIDPLFWEGVFPLLRRVKEVLCAPFTVCSHGPYC